LLGTPVHFVFAFMSLGYELVKFHMFIKFIMFTKIKAIGPKQHNVHNVHDVHPSLYFQRLTKTRGRANVTTMFTTFTDKIYRQSPVGDSWPNPYVS
jgi:hypothetical protein